MKIALVAYNGGTVEVAPAAAVEYVADRATMYSENSELTLQLRTREVERMLGRLVNELAGAKLLNAEQVKRILGRFDIDVTED